MCVYRGPWLGLLPGPHSSFLLSLQLEQRGRLQKSVAKEVSVQGTFIHGERVSVFTWVGWQLA